MMELIPAMTSGLQMLQALFDPFDWFPGQARQQADQRFLAVGRDFEAEAAPALAFLRRTLP